jgi:hypothetical protein
LCDNPLRKAQAYFLGKVSCRTAFELSRSARSLHFFG